MKNSRTRLPHAERGAVLVIALIMLAVMTLFVISMLKTSVIELKIGGASQIAALNLSNAEFAINNFIAMNTGLFAPNFASKTEALGGPRDVSLSYVDTVGNQAKIKPLQLDCAPWFAIGTQYGPNSLQAVQFDVAATATGSLGYGCTTVVHQGLQTLAPPNSC